MSERLSRRGFVLAGAAVALSGCATAPRLKAGETLPELEPLLAASADGWGLTITVASRGCTRREDFVFRVESRGHELAVAFARRRLDVCRVPGAAPVALRFDYAELGVKPGQDVIILNPRRP